MYYRSVPNGDTEGFTGEKYDFSSPPYSRARVIGPLAAAIVR
jgi:hypothetical protein